MDNKKAGRTPIALRVLKELVLPVAGGVAYGTIVAQAKQMPLDGVTAGGVAFFCILAAQGLVLRAARTARSEQQPAAQAVPVPAPEPLKLPAPEKVPEKEKEPEPAPALIATPTVEPTVEPVAKPVEEPAPVPVATPVPEPVAKPAPKPANDFVSIRVGIEELKEQGALPEPEPEKPEDGQRPLFRNLAHAPTKRTPVEALAPKQLLDLKMPYQAVLNAAVNFEREVKRHAGIPDDRTSSLESLFEQPRFNLSNEKLKQLETLRRIRNNILHGFETLVDPIEAAALVAAFDKAATWFDPANIEPVAPPKAEPEKRAEDEAEEPTTDEAEKPTKYEVKNLTKDAEKEPAKTEATEPTEDGSEKPAETQKPAEKEPEKPAEDESAKKSDDAQVKTITGI